MICMLFNGVTMPRTPDSNPLQWRAGFPVSRAPIQDGCRAAECRRSHTPTGLAGYLRDRGLRRIFMVGLATDFCVHYSAVDARRLGFDTVLVESGCRAIDLAGSLDAAWAGMAEAGVQRVNDL